MNSPKGSIQNSSTNSLSGKNKKQVILNRSEEAGRRLYSRAKTPDKTSVLNAQTQAKLQRLRHSRQGGKRNSTANIMNANVGSACRLTDGFISAAHKIPSSLYSVSFNHNHSISEDKLPGLDLQCWKKQDMYRHKKIIAECKETMHDAIQESKYKYAKQNQKFAQGWFRQLSEDNQERVKNVVERALEMQQIRYDKRQEQLEEQYCAELIKYFQEKISSSKKRRSQILKEILSAQERLKESQKSSVFRQKSACYSRKLEYCKCQLNLVDDGIERFEAAIDLLCARELETKKQVVKRPKTASKYDVFDYSYGVSSLDEGVVAYLRHQALNGKKFNYREDYQDWLEQVSAAKEWEIKGTKSFFDDLNFDLLSEDNL